MKNNQVLFLIIFLLCIKVVSAQIFNFKEYNSSNGFPNDYVYDLAQDEMGYLWAATATGLVSYNGKQFTTYKYSSKKPENLILDLYLHEKDVWICGKDGAFGKVEGEDNIKTYDIGFKNRVNKIIGLGDILFVCSQDEGAVFFDINRKKVIGKVDIHEKGIDRINDALKYKDLIILSSNSGVFSVSIDIDNRDIKILQKYPEIQMANSLCLDKSTLLIGTENDGIFALDINNEKFVNPREFFPEYFKKGFPIKHVFADSYSQLWVSTFGSGVLELSNWRNSDLTKIYHHKKSNNISIEYVNSCLEDYEGNIWIGTFGSGVLSNSNDFVKLIPIEGITDKAVSAVTHWNNELLVCIKNEIYTITKNDEAVKRAVFPNAKAHINSFAHNERNIFIGTNDHGVWVWDPIKNKFQKLNYSSENLSLKVRHLFVDNNFLWISTYNGLARFDLNTNKVFWFNTSNGFRHNMINVVNKIGDEIVVGSKSNRIFFIKNNQIREELLPSVNPNVNVSDIKVLGDRVYIGTMGSGFFVRVKDEVLQFQRENGMNSNFVYGIQVLDKNYVILVHEESMSIFGNKDLKFLNFEKNFGLMNEFQVRSIYKLNANELYFGSDHGLLKFNPQEYLNHIVVPRMGFNHLFINDVLYDTEVDIIELPSGKYKVSLDYKGVSFSNSDNINYSYMLKGFDEDWHDGSIGDRAVYNNLPPGKYTFLLRASIGEEILTKTSNFVIFIDKPLYQKSWFIVLCIGLFLLFIFFVFWIQSRSNLRKKKMLEYHIEVKTRELQFQNEKMLSSISYAKRIQDVVLPKAEEIKFKTLKAASINMSKDIVGGDFFWFDQSSENVFYLALCDCTGHGVPGGFMTLLGVNGLNKALEENPLALPNVLLTAVHENIFRQMHHADGESLKDGMDVGLLRVDYKEKKIHFSGARRPMIYLNNQSEVKVLKGTRKSIGDNLDKYQFENTELMFSDIKTICLFSDGYVDQFGGANLKKLGIQQLNIILQNATNMPLHKQIDILKEEILIWKSTADGQTDDISLLLIEL